MTACSARPGWTQAELDRGYVVFPHSTLVNLEPDFVPVRESVAKRLSCKLARGEYKSVKIGVHALGEDLHDVRLELATDLEARIYRPIDEATRRMLASSVNPVPGRHAAAGRDHADGRNPTTVIDLQAACLDESDVIADLSEATTSYFWLTLHARQGTTPGRHSARIRIQPAGRPAVEIDLDVTVRPFELQRARIVFAQYLYYVHYQRYNYLPRFAQNLAWYRKIFRDMAEHSLTSVMGLGIGEPGWAIDWAKRPPEGGVFTDLLPMAVEAGLMSPDVPVVHGAILQSGEQRISFDMRPTVAQKNEAVDWYEAERQKHGWPELAAYARDEPRYPADASLVRQESTYFRDVKMRLATSLDANAAYGLGDVHDIWIVRAGDVTPELIREARRMGAAVWSYTPRIYAAEPLRVRYYAGLYTWAHRLKGQCMFAHYAFQSYKHIWVREGDERPMPMVGWETRREGIDDYRYLQMLEDCIAARPGHRLAAEARAWLERLRAQVMPVDPHAVRPGLPLAVEAYDRIREKAAEYVQRLGPVPADSIEREPVTRLKDEAQLFRGKTVEQCIEGLESGDVTKARAAAWAIREMGGQGAAAVPALVKLLDEPQVRMPVLRALEAIGPESLPALAKLRVLVEHPDAFVRLGATYAAGAIGGPAIDVLITAARDDYTPVPYAVLHQLARMSKEDTRAALPVLIELLEKATWEGGPNLTLKAIAALGPGAEAAAPHLVAFGKRQLFEEGSWPDQARWIDPLVVMGGGSLAVPMLEDFLDEHGSNAKFPVDAVVRYSLYKIRRTPADLQALVALARGEGGGARDAGGAKLFLEMLSKKDPDVAAKIHALMDAGRAERKTGKRVVESEHGPVHVMSLPAAWRFALDPNKRGMDEAWYGSDFNDAKWAQVRTDLDKGWQPQGFAGGQDAFGWYRLRFNTPAEFDRPKLYLVFEAVDEDAHVYINGTKVFEHSCASTGLSPDEIWSAAFVVEVTGRLRPGAEDLIAVGVYNRAYDGGIHKPVHLIATDADLDIRALLKLVAGGS